MEATNVCAEVPLLINGGTVYMSQLRKICLVSINEIRLYWFLPN